MSFELVRAIGVAENSDNFHLGRLLLLLLAVDSNKSQPIDGITKLAKLDFLLRYPNCLERALLEIKKNAEPAHIQPYERTTIESKMIRFKYGPWDNRYRRWIGLLSARGLIKVEIKGRTVVLGLTDSGREVAISFSENSAYDDLSIRVTTQGKGVTKSGKKGASVNARRKAARAFTSFFRAVER
jgi:hypothetical protein